MTTVDFSIRGIDDKEHFHVLSQTILDLPGVTDVNFNLANHSVTVTYDDSLISSQDISQSISLAGYMF